MIVKERDIVIIDDDISSLEFLDYNFLKAGYNTKCFSASSEALSYLKTTKVDGIITDWVMPEYDGLELVSELQHTLNSSTIKVMVSSNDSENGVIEAFHTGVDDYMIKPLRVRELMVRMKILLSKQETNFEINEVLSFDRLVLDKSKFEVKVGREKLKLSKSEFKVLALMIRNRGRLMSREYLLDSLHGENSVSTSRSIDVIVHALRRKLAKYNFHHIHTVYGMGYKLE